MVLQIENVETVTWAQFLPNFYRKYLGEAQLSGKVHELMNLTQGRMSVAEYTAKFYQLARFATSMIPTNEA